MIFYIKIGLHKLLASFAKPNISGSYALNLMTWRDLDIYLESAVVSEQKFFELGSKIHELLHPVKMSFRNELVAQTKGLPHGLYWGVYLGDERAGAWKIDIWCVAPDECKRLLNTCTAIQSKLTPAFSGRIMKIKSQCWQDRNYRKTFNSMEIFDAVLFHGITDIAGFREYLIANKK